MIPALKGLLPLSGGLTSIAAKLLGGTLVLAISFTASLWIMDAIWPREGREPDAPPALAAAPPLPPATRQSVIIAPVAIALPAIRDTLDRLAPRDLTGKPDNPLSKVLQKAELGFTVARSPLAVSGGPNGMTFGTNLDGSLRIVGQIGTQAAGLGGAITGLLDDKLGKKIEGFAGKALDQRADFHGNVAVTSRPAITTNWRIEPNLTGQVNLGDNAVSISGLKLNVGKEVKPLIDKSVNEQIAALQARLRNDPFLENAVRKEWAKMCRSIPLGGGNTGLPNLWLELRPTRAFAAQPKVDAQSLILTLGVQADSRIIANENQPSCPFPARLEMVPPLDQGRVTIGVPIDVPFTEVNKLLETQLKGRKFPDDPNAPAEVTVQRAKIAASGDRLLISLLVKAKEKKSWFGFGTEATVHVWGKPALDREQQILRLREISLAVESEAAFGLLGAAARAAMPYVQAALEKNAVVDLKPFAANARTSIEKALADFRQQSDDVRVDAAVTGLRLADIAFDATTLRVIAEADGNVRASVTRLP